MPAPLVALVLLLVGRLADDAAVERHAVELHGEAAILVAPGRTDAVPEALAVASFPDVVGDVRWCLTGGFGFSGRVGHGVSPSFDLQPRPSGPYGSDQTDA